MDRLQHNLPVLQESRQLDIAAQTKAEDMFNKGYFAHITPDGVTPWEFIYSAGYHYNYAGENLARRFTTAESEEQAWMSSPSHAENILNPLYTQIGVGVAGEYVVVMFGQPL